jgi:hypothetical protein
MNINRYNYEEFFLLYVDNELPKAERQAVEAFVHDNPDLEEELIMLKQSKLRPDAAITFQGKEMLLKPENAGFINETNYEEFFLLYVDNELNAAERREVESFAATKPQFQQELNLLMQTKVEPEYEVAFPDKSLLYKEEKRRPAIIIGWQRVVAVAAMMVLALGIFWLLNTGDKKSDTLAKTGTRQQQENSNANSSGNTDAAHDAGKDGKTGATDNIAETREPKSQFSDVNDAANQPQVAAQTNQGKANKQANPGSNNYREPVKNDAQLAYEPKANAITDPSEQTGKSLAVVDVAITDRNSAGNVSTAVQTANTSSGIRAIGQPVQTVAYIEQDVEQDDKVYFANTTVDRKNKLRGLFRKVTRVFEKTTNLPAVEEKGILIGNLEIALK